MCANPRSFSQLTTSFVASESLGIRHTPLTISFLFLVTQALYALGFLFVMSLPLMSMILIAGSRYKVLGSRKMALIFRSLNFEF